MSGLQTTRKPVRLAELYPMMRETLDAGGEVILPVTGTSMKPTLLGGRDSVTLVRASSPLRRYDLPLYRRSSGQFVLHRIIAVEPDGTYTCCGDHQWSPERGIRPDQIVALTVRFCRKGKTVAADDPGYLRRVRFWVAIRPLRRVLMKAAGALSRLKRRIIRKPS